MIEVKHTPAPWTVCFEIYDRQPIAFHIAASPFGSLKPVCEARLSESHPEMAANAQVIAAAPEMLAALQMVRDQNGSNKHFPCDCMTAIIAAITKATKEDHHG